MWETNNFLVKFLNSSSDSLINFLLSRLLWLSSKEFGERDYSMILYPTTVLFRYTFAVQKALENLPKENLCLKIVL